MAIRFSVSDPQQGKDRLGFALFLALALHGLIIFGVGFKYLESRSKATSLAVTVIQNSVKEKITDSDLMASANQRGSGNPDDEKTALTSNQMPTFAAAVLREAQLPQPPQYPTEIGDLSQRTLATSDKNRLATAAKPEKGDKKSTVTDNERPPVKLVELSSLRAQWATQKEAYNQMPRTLRLTSMNAQQADHAAYLKYWIDKVELTGNLYYPNEARRRKLFGALRLAVTLLPDGSVDTVEILLGSEHQLLDLAAVETVRRASPFPAFPPEMIGWDKIEIIQTWHFLPGNRLTTR